MALLILGIFSSPGSATQIGKIAGKVMTTEGEPIIGANVVVEGTMLGGATDLEGRYFILAVSPGRITLHFSAVGFRSERVREVVVVSGRTARVDVSLVEEALELEPVVVTFKHSPVALTETNQRISVEGDVVRQMPLRRAEEIVMYQAGVSRDASGELHIRGGRSGEIGYFVDGLRVEDPLYGEQTAVVGREALQELQVLSGTFNAEYGEAMSGIINIITREGTEVYGGSFEYESAILNSSLYRRADWVNTGSDAVRDTVSGGSLYEPTSVRDASDLWISVPGRFSATLSGPFPVLSHTTFFLHGVHESEDSHLPFGDMWARRLTGKLTGNISSGKLTLSFGLRGKSRQNYSHTWKYVSEHYHRHFERNQRVSLTWIHNVDPSLFYEITSGYYQRRHDVKIFEDWDDYLSAGYTPEDFTYAQYFYDQDDWSDTWRESLTRTINAGSKLTWQMNPTHQWRAGFEARSQDIELEDIRDLRIGDEGQREGLSDSYRERPIEAWTFVQDKIELDYLVVNAGLRLDYVDPRAKGWLDPENPTYFREDVKASTQVSPRLGLAHPVNDRVTLHYAYGHFFQFPDYVSLFLNSSDMNPDTLSNRTFDAVGNPGLKPQKTVAYEVGLKGVVTDVWGLTATAFYKDISDLVGTRQVRIGTSYNYSAFVNIDYASVVGFEIGATRMLSDFWSLQANYTYSVAKGNSSEPTTGYWDAYEGIPIARQEYYMDFDRRHVANVLITWQSGREAYPRFFGTTILRGAGAGLIVNLATGLPYTPYSAAGEQLALRNSERMDHTLRVDVRLAKTVLFDPVRLTLFGSADNLFDRQNPLVVNIRTGKPWETTLIGNEVIFDQIHNPSNVDIPRLLRMGLLMEF